MATMDSAGEDPGYKRLFELEAEYRAPRVADKLHAIVSFSHLFDDFPNPSIINSGFLKLADYFASRYLPFPIIFQIRKTTRQSHHSP